MLLTRYGNIDYVLKLRFKDARKLIQKAKEESNKDKVFELFLVERSHLLFLSAYGHAKQKDFISFDEYYEKVSAPVVKKDNRSTDDIMKEILELKFE